MQHDQSRSVSDPRPDAGEHAAALVLLDDVVDDLKRDDGLPETRAAEDAGLCAFDQRIQKVDDLDAGLEKLVALAFLAAEIRDLGAGLGAAFCPRRCDSKRRQNVLTEHYYKYRSELLSQLFPCQQYRCKHLRCHVYENS